MRKNFIDKAVTFLSPEKAVERIKARQKLEFLNSGYSHYAGNTFKKTMIGWDSESNSPIEDINDNMPIVRERSRDLYMGGSNIATGIINTTRTNVIGSGLVLKPSIDSAFLKMSDEEAKAWEQNTVREFEYFANSVNCDRFRMNNFYELQQLAFLSMLLSGDVFVLLPHMEKSGFIYDLSIQLIEADRIRTPDHMVETEDISQGVETRKGEVHAYYVFDKHPNHYESTCKKIKAFGDKSNRRNILHLMESERPGQTRGVPFLAPVIESLRQLGRYTQAELTAALVGSKFTVFIKTATPEHSPGEGIPPEQQLDADNPHSYELGDGSVVNLAIGESIEIANPGRNSKAFEEFVSSILKQTGAALGMPYELVIMHFSSSYSASRAALLEAWKMFRMRRAWFAKDFCQPIYEEWLAEAIAKGRIHAPGFFEDPIVRAAYCKAEWHGPAKGEIDQYRTAKATELLIDLGITTGEREAAEITGTDFNVNHRQRVKEELMRKELREITGELKGGEED